MEFVSLQYSVKTVIIFKQSFKERITNGDGSQECTQNGDEAGLLKIFAGVFPLLRPKTKATGYTKNKEHVAIMICANAEGHHKIPILLLGKYKSHRLTKDLKLLPLEFRTEKKFMNGLIFLQIGILMISAICEKISIAYWTIKKNYLFIV